MEQTNNGLIERLISVTAGLIVVLVIDTHREVDQPIVIGRNANGPTECLQISRADVCVQRSVEVITIGDFLGETESPGHGVIERHVDHASQILLAEIRDP